MVALLGPGVLNSSPSEHLRPMPIYLLSEDTWQLALGHICNRCETSPREMKRGWNVLLQSFAHVGAK